MVSRLITVWHGLFIMITVAQRLLILFRGADPSLASQTERTIGSHGDRLRLARSNLPEMRSGIRAETPVHHERGKSWRRTLGGMFVRLAAITGYPRRLYSIVYTDVDSPFHVPMFFWAKGEAPMTSFHLQVRFWERRGEAMCPLQRRPRIFCCPTGIALSNFGACH